MSNYPDKLKKYEVVPPSQVWNNIAAELDKNADGEVAATTLYNTIAAPPAHIWNNITAELDESLLQNKFPSVLANMEVVPPATVWNHIDAELYPSQTPVVSINRKRNAFVRYAAAAMLIGIAALGIIKWTAGTSDDTAGVATAETNRPPLKRNISGPSTSNTGATTIPAITPEEKEVVASVTDVQNTTKERIRRQVPVTNATYAYDASGEQAGNPLYAYEDHIPRMADRYIMLMTPEGNFIRMSKKWSDMVCCVSGEEQDAGCKSQLKEWHEKMATSAVATSPGNFLDILSLVNSLDDAGTEL